MSVKIIHTSPAIIENINKYGGCAGNGTLFFSTNGYSTGAANYTYTLKISDDQVVNASDLYDEDIVSDIANYFDCDTELAESLLDASESEWDQEFDCDGEDSWWLQGVRAECARKMGYVACEDEDENGVVFMIQMNDEILNKMELQND